MYGRGGGVLGASTTVTGVLALPNTSGNLGLQILSLATTTIGVAILASFVVTRIAHFANR